MSDIDKTEPELLSLYSAIREIVKACDRDYEMPSMLGTHDPAYALRIMALIRDYGASCYAEGLQSGGKE